MHSVFTLDVFVFVFFVCLFVLLLLFFSQINQDVFFYTVVMAGCTYTVGEMNAMLIVVLLNEIVSSVGVLSLHGQPLPMVIVHH